VHHLDAVELGGPMLADLGRLLPVCRRCHKLLHDRPRSALAGPTPKNAISRGFAVLASQKT